MRNLEIKAIINCQMTRPNFTWDLCRHVLICKNQATWFLFSLKGSRLMSANSEPILLKSRRGTEFYGGYSHSLAWAHGKHEQRGKAGKHKECSEDREDLLCLKYRILAGRKVK